MSELYTNLVVFWVDRLRRGWQFPLTKAQIWEEFLLDLPETIVENPLTGKDYVGGTE